MTFKLVDFQHSFHYYLNGIDIDLTADFWNEMEDVDLKLSAGLSRKLEQKKLYQLLGFSAKQIGEIEAKAKTENIDSKELIRKWVLEHV